MMIVRQHNAKHDEQLALADTNLGGLSASDRIGVDGLD
jgi:hypothetical protein